MAWASVSTQSSSAGVSRPDRIRYLPRLTERTVPICHEYPQSHSLLLDRGLIRVGLPWPPKAADGTPIKPEFTIEVVRDPTGCNTSPVYGLNSPTPTISVYRRPRPAANLKYVIADGFGVGRFIAKNGQPTERDPETGKLVQMNMMADARE